MLRDSAFVVGLILYVLVARATMTLPLARRGAVFAVLNIATVAALFFGRAAHAEQLLLVAYVTLVAAQWILTRSLARRRGAWPWVAFLAPIVALALVKYVPLLLRPPWGSIGLRAGAAFVGLSYMAFRLSYLVLEVRNGLAALPSFGRYLAFAFFPVTLAVGPISPYALYDASFVAPSRTRTPLAPSLLRMVVGLTKYLFLGTLFNQLSYAGLELDKRPHPRVDWVVAAVFYYLYLYCNFSGVCDLGIGAAGAIGIQVRENFDNPFAARNVKDFWNRWHITLSMYMRDVVFTPLSKVLVGRLGPANADHSVAIAVFVVFVLVGVWHGVGYNFLAFGVLHALAVVGNHYYGIALKKYLGRDGVRAYLRNPVVHGVSVALTFAYVTVTLGFFANRGSVERVITLLWGGR